ncbi:tyrosine-type recombinase/integrase [Paenibacillus sp. GCM10012307]|uniref:Tyrosine-type recombinase/integrase n=1 Tax=Paenibacillus roseus TaxID=2798579 RepID=A0A934MQF1_9BACL|nr:tyrosine-type recombinase/integrase [Paenibacillus roseus]MBJ6361823.1 tyrosine-type recombinase/integrase [Paenibacillus roseus]
MAHPGFKEWLQDKMSSPHTILRYSRIAADFEKWCKEHGVVKVDSEDLANWKEYLLNATYVRAGQQHRYRPSTVSNAIKGIKAYLEYLVSIGALSPHILELKNTNLLVKSKSQWLDDPKIEKLLNHFSKEWDRLRNPWRYTRNRAIVFSMLYGGLRVSEVARLESEHIRIVNGNMLLDIQGSQKRQIAVIGQLKEAIEEWLIHRGNTGTDKLFVSQRGGPLTTNGIEHMFKHQELHGITPHALRNTFVYDLANIGLSATSIANELGHSNGDYITHMTKLFDTNTPRREIKY